MRCSVDCCVDGNFGAQSRVLSIILCAYITCMCRYRVARGSASLWRGGRGVAGAGGEVLLIPVRINLSSAVVWRFRHPAHAIELCKRMIRTGRRDATRVASSSHSTFDGVRTEECLKPPPKRQPGHCSHLRACMDCRRRCVCREHVGANCMYICVCVYEHVRAR